VGEQEEQVVRVARRLRVDQDRALAQQVGVLLQQEVAHRQHERMAGVHQLAKARPGLVGRAHGGLGEADPLVALEHGRELAAVAAGDEAVAFAEFGGTWVISKRSASRG
jgi:hypothetical protein